MATQRQKDLIKKYFFDYIRINPSRVDQLVDSVLTDSQLNTVFSVMKQDIRPSVAVKKGDIARKKTRLETQESALSDDLNDLT